MNIIPATFRETMTIGGRVFGDLANLIQLQAYNDSTGAQKFSTLRNGTASAGYQVTTGKTLKIGAVRFWILGGQAASRYIQMGYGDTDVGLSGAAAPTNATYLSSGAGSSTQLPFNTAGNAQNPAIEVAVRIDVPATKYFFMSGTTGLEFVGVAFGYEA